MDNNEGKEVLAETALEGNNRYEAMKRLFDNQKKTDAVIRYEKPLFQYYINRAIDNVQNIVGLAKEAGDFRNHYEPKDVRNALDKNADAVEKLADFLWLFKLDCPAKEAKKGEVKRFTIELACRLYQLRNFFCHSNESGIDALLVNDRGFYTLFAGYLADLGRDYVRKHYSNTDKMSEMKLMNYQAGVEKWENANARPKNAENERPKFVATQYNFTRKGLILLICMALWKDEAAEFCQSLHDLKLTKKDMEEAEVEEWCSEDLREDMTNGTTLRKKCGKRRALQEFFTYFSQRRGYNAVNPEDPNFASFTNIVGYLNKVPAIAWDCLSLDGERKRLEELKAASTESEDVKETKYKLHKRFKDRTLSFLAGYCEDFKIFRAMHFKRMDTTPRYGRQRYCFENEGENTTCRQNRHFAIKDNAIRFEWRPKKHYGDIHIDALRSAVSQDELSRMIIAEKMLQKELDNGVDAYFAAYHRVYEKALQEGGNESYIDRTEYLEDFATITGATPEELKDDAVFREKMTPYFPMNFTRFFIPDENRPSDDQLKEQLLSKLKTVIKKDDELLGKMRQIRDWRCLTLAERQANPLPRDCRFNDGDLAHCVFETLNLYLSNENKYRQLPRAEYHRGEKDYEYQMMQAKIGRFGMDQQAFWDALNGVKSIYRGSKEEGTRECIRVDSVPALAERAKELAEKGFVLKLKGEYQACFRAESQMRSAHEEYDANGRVKRARPSLALLGEAAVKCHRDYCNELRKELRESAVSRERLEQECRRFDLRIGMPLSRQALLKTILRIDENQWRNAYNYQENCKWIGRDLKQEGHVVTQVPFTNFFTNRLCLASTNKGMMKFVENGYCKFGKILNERMDCGIALRDFYDITPLLNLRKDSKAVAGTRWNPALPEEMRSEEPMPSRGGLLQLAKKLREVGSQDALLLYIVKKYYDKYQTNNAVVRETGRTTDSSPCVYDYFDKEEILREGDLKIRIRPNDRLRWIYGKLKKNLKALAKTYTAEEKRETLDFYDVVAKMRRIEAADRKIRIPAMAQLLALENRVIEPLKAEQDKWRDAVEERLRAQGVEDKQEIKRQQSEEVMKKLYPFYLAKVNGARPKDKEKKLSREAFGKLGKFRNVVFHDGFNIQKADVEEFNELLRKCWSIDKDGSTIVR